MLMRVRNLTSLDNQNGFAAIVIALVLILVLSLMTVGFAQLMQSEQHSALDKQLSSQAYYAAETGVNDAVNAINDGYTATKTGCGTNDVDPNNSQPAHAQADKDLSDNTVGGTSGPTAASYTCLLINPTPPYYEKNPVSSTESDVVEIEGVDPNDTSNPQVIQSITISWQDAGNNTTFVPSTDCTNPGSPPTAFSSTTQWNATGLLRFELIPITQLDRDSLIQKAFTAFLCPANTGTRAWTPSSTVNYASGLTNSGVVVDGSCSTNASTATDSSLEPNNCNVEITGLGGLQETAFFLDLRSIYNPTAVYISIYGSGSPPGNQLDIAGAQTLIDSTGKAQDVLRRVQVGVPSKNGYYIPDGTYGNTICKQLALVPAGTPNVSSTTRLPACAILP